MANFFRSDCPVTTAVDLLGDRWVLVIVKQMLLERKSTFKDFTDSEESIASNILTNRLTQLLEWGLVSRAKLGTNKKVVYYHLTDEGLSLASIIVELALWSDKNLRAENPTMRKSKDLKDMRAGKEKFVTNLIKEYKRSLPGLNESHGKS